MRLRVLGALLLLSACGRVAEQDGERTDGGPNVNVTAAPGVAFAYDYTFRLPAAAIAGTQETHAQACEALGITRCRITGMTYQVRGAEGVDATLTFALAPPVARSFGRSAMTAVVKADGMLARASITGNDVTDDAAAAAKARDEATEDARRADSDLAAADAANERIAVADRRDAARERARGAAIAQAEQRAMLASTPMTFRYETGEAVRRFRVGSPILRALDAGLLSAQTTFGVVLWGIAVLAPPALALALLWLTWRWRGRAIWRRLKGDAGHAD